MKSKKFMEDDGITMDSLGAPLAKSIVATDAEDMKVPNTDKLLGDIDPLWDPATDSPDQEDVPDDEKAFNDSGDELWDTGGDETEVIQSIPDDQSIMQDIDPLWSTSESRPTAKGMSQFIDSIMNSSPIKR